VRADLFSYSLLYLAEKFLRAEEQIEELNSYMAVVTKGLKRKEAEKDKKELSQ
jgi:hypothetical protein